MKPKTVVPRWQSKAKKIKMFAMDVDGVLTDGSIIIYDSGEEIKLWNVKDRMAFSMLRHSGAVFRTAWITGRKSRQVARRAREIGVDVLCQDCLNKGKALNRAARRFGLKMEEILYIGDDLVDVTPLKMAGLAVCPRDAHDEAKKVCDWVARVPGGRGVFREAVDAVLKAQGLWQKVIRSYDPYTERTL